jgi:hypothetical protein
MTWAMARKSSLAAEAAPRCTRCGSERIVKNGKNACGRQQFRCRACGACRALHLKSRTAPPERQAEILRAVALERLSLGRQTRQIIAFFVGDRSAESARTLRMRIPPDYRCRASRSDFWLACEAAFPKRTRSPLRQGRGPDQPRRTLVLHVAPASGPLRAQNPFLFQCERMHEVALRLFIQHYNQQPII